MGSGRLIRTVRCLLVFVLGGWGFGSPHWPACAQIRVELDFSALARKLGDSAGDGIELVRELPGIRWIFVDPSEVCSPYLPGHLFQVRWQPVSPEEFHAWLEDDSLLARRAMALDSLRARAEVIVQQIQVGLERGLWRGFDGTIRCTFFFHPQAQGVYWAAAGEELAFSISPYFSQAPQGGIDWRSFYADLLEACYSLLTSQLLTEGDLLLESTGNHAAVREDLIDRYGFGIVSVASRVLGRPLHRHDPERLRALLDRWAVGLTFSPKHASRAAEFFRQTVRLGMRSWLSAPVRGIPDSAIYFFQLRPWLPSLRQDAQEFQRAFLLALTDPPQDYTSLLRELDAQGVLSRLGFYMARRIEYVLGRERLLKDFSHDEVTFFLDYIALQQEADLRFGKEVCVWVFDLANELDRLRYLASQE
ncbi:MAG: hypothetical protein ONB23_10525 [candidate division KSB1 bacterium]|nr:hypothetical protein [candidate division KSB1 bacterium]